MKDTFQGVLDQLKVQLHALGETFGETFKQVGQAAAQQGTDLLNQALTQGTQLAANGATSKTFSQMYKRLNIMQFSKKQTKVKLSTII